MDAMSFASHFITRRGTEMISTQLQYRDESHGSKPQWLTSTIFILTILIGIAFLVAILCVDYTCDLMAVTLAAVEDSHPSIYTRIGNEDSTDSFDTSDPEDVIQPRTEPITASLRSTLKYLRARGGFWSYLRGWRSYIRFAGTTFLTLSLSGLIPLPGPPFIRLYIRSFATSIPFATWEMAWIHIVIADQLPKTSYRRMLGFRHWPKIAPAAALWYGVLYMTTSPVETLATVFFRFPGSTSGETYKLVFKILVANAITAVFGNLVSLPARVIFVRVAASMLREDTEPIVQFDRAFGGRVKSESMGGSGKLSIKDAWTTWEWPARIRCVKMVLKAMAIQSVLYTIGILVIMGMVALNMSF